MRVRLTVMPKPARAAGPSDDMGRAAAHRGGASARCEDGIRCRPAMRIGVPKETAAGERRVALVPEVVGKLTARGVDVLVESGAGAGALVTDVGVGEAGAPLSWRSKGVGVSGG